jgi:hypothetical protein
MGRGAAEQPTALRAPSTASGRCLYVITVDLETEPASRGTHERIRSRGAECRYRPVSTAAGPKRSNGSVRATSSREITMRTTIGSTFGLAAAYCAAIGLFAAAPPLARTPVPAQERSGLAPPELNGDVPRAIGGEVTEGIFFAVLEGCYEDGATTELVDAMRAAEPKSGYPANFVYACPICMPVLSALDLYAARQPFRSSKTRGDTFGTGVEPALATRILGKDAADRRVAIETLVGRWIRRWLDAHRLTDAERAAWATEFANGRKIGMEFLEAYRRAFPDAGFDAMKTCPACEAANGACRRE